MSLPSTEEILNEREKTHGSYSSQAVTAQCLKSILHATINWDRMPPPMKESLELICTKMSRICHGDFLHADSFFDIAGYAQLIVRELEKK